MTILKSKKAIIAALSLGGMVLAGVVKDINSRTVRREQASLELALAPVDGVTPTGDLSQKIAVMYLPMNAEGFNKINSEWEITRIIGSNEVVAFDKLNNTEDAKKMIKVNMELVGTSAVRIDNDNGQTYKVSLLSDFGTIALFKKMGNGFEIIEARRVEKKNENGAFALNNNEEGVELVLERALNQAKSPKILTGENVSGQMTLTSKSIEGLKVDLKNANGEDQSVDIANIDLMDGGAFKADVDGDEVTGVVFSNGKEGYRLSFMTGPLAGAMLNFVTAEQMTKIEEGMHDDVDRGLASNGHEEEAKTKEKENMPVVEIPMAKPNEEMVDERVSESEASLPVEMTMAQEQAIEERRQIASEENQEPIEVLSAEEIKETAQEQGFAF